MKDDKPGSPHKNQSKKRYQQPQLEIYGDLREVTQATLAGMTADSAKGKANKTSP
jgi:hypothetical protein